MLHIFYYNTKGNEGTLLLLPPTQNWHKEDFDKDFREGQDRLIVTRL